MKIHSLPGALTALIILLSMTLQAQKDTVSTCIKMTTKVAVDGQLNDWQIPLKFYDKKTSVAYSIANDDKNLYIVYRISDSLLYHKILRTGMIVQIDTLGKKDGQLAISFPMPVRPDRASASKSGGRISTQELVNEAKMMELSGFKSGNGRSPNVAKNGIAASIQLDGNKDFIAEFRIPLKELTAGAIEKFQTNAMGINLMIPAMKSGAGEGEARRPQQAGDSQMGPGRGHGGGSMGGRPGGGRGEGGGMGGGRPGGGQSRLKSEQQVYQRIVLSK